MSLADIRITDHPSAQWAMQTEFSATDVDCTTTVVLKILDNKCKMLPGEKMAVMAVYDVVKNRSVELFDDSVHLAIQQARQSMSDDLLQRIHALRVEAEQKIPKPVMKKYKAFLRDGLFG